MEGVLGDVHSNLRALISIIRSDTARYIDRGYNIPLFVNVKLVSPILFRDKIYKI